MCVKREEFLCTPGESVCVGDRGFSTCNTNGSDWFYTACQQGKVCKTNFTLPQCVFPEAKLTPSPKTKFIDLVYEPCKTTKECGGGLACVENRCVSGCGKNGTVPCADGCQPGYYLNAKNIYDSSDDRCQTNLINPIYVDYSGQHNFTKPQTCKELGSWPPGVFNCELNQCQVGQTWINASCGKLNEVCCGKNLNCIATNSMISCNADNDCCTSNDYCDVASGGICKNRIMTAPDYTHPEKFFCSGTKDEWGNDLLAIKGNDNQLQIVGSCFLKIDEVCQNGKCVYFKNANQQWLDSIPPRDSVHVRLLITDQNGREVNYEEIFEEGTFDWVWEGEVLYRANLYSVSNVNPPVLKYCITANKVAAVIPQEMELIGDKYCGELKFSTKELYDARTQPLEHGDTIELQFILPFDFIKDYGYADAVIVNPKDYSSFSCYEKGGICEYWGCGKGESFSGVCRDLNNTSSRQTECCQFKPGLYTFNDPEAEKYALELEDKYGIKIENMEDYEWSMEMLNFMDSVLSDLPKFTYVNMIYLGGSHKTVGGWGWANKAKIGINLQQGKECLNWADNLSEIEYCKSEIKKTIVHETTHSIDDYLGSYTTGSLPVALMEIIERAGWYWDPETNRYRLFADSPALFGWSWKEEKGKDIYTLKCDPKTQIKDCNKYWSYQFANPVEMLAVHAEVYFYGSQEFCQRLPDFCVPMRRLFENREYLNGQWINDPDHPYYLPK